MAISPDPPKRPRRWARRLAIAAAAGLGCLVVLVLALPWIISLPFVQRLLAAQANRVIAPSSVRFEGVSVWWTRPTEIVGLALRDAQGDEVLASPRASFSWSLRELLVTRPKEMTLTLNQATMDIERGGNGQVDLLETLRPVIQERPERTLLIRIPDGKLRVRAEGLNDAFLAGPADIAIDLNAYPGAVAWRMTLHREVAGSQPGQVKVEGSVSRQMRPSGAPEELSLSVLADRWPWLFTGQGIEASGGLSGTIQVEDKAEGLSLKGDARILNLLASGDRLSGDKLALESVAATWDASRQGEAWTIRRLDLTTSLGKLNASGSYPPAGDPGARVDGSLDLPALARQLPRTLGIRGDLQLDKGSAEIHADVRGDADKKTQTINASARLTDLAARQGSRTLVYRDPATLSARLHRQADSLTLEELEIKTPFLTATGRGDLDRGIRVVAVVDLGGGSQRLRDWIDLGRLELAGQGKIEARYRRVADRFEASAEAEFKGLDLKGLPAIDTFRRDLLASTFKASGGAGPSGLPAILYDLTLTGGDDEANVSLTATRDQAGALTALLKGGARLVINGEKQDAEATVRSRWDDAQIGFDPIAISLAPMVGPGGAFLPGEPVQWTGKGTYDRAKDVLRIAANAPAAGTRPLAIAPVELRAGGLAAREAFWLELSLGGNLAALNSQSNPDRTRLDGQVAGLVQVRQQPDGWDLGARLDVHELARLDAKGEKQVLLPEAGARVRGNLARGLERIDLSELAVLTSYGKIDGAGAVSDLRGSRRFDLKGIVSPDWAALSDLLAKKVEPNASIAGTARPWRVSGTFSTTGTPDLRSTLNGELGLALEQVDVFGMRLGQTVLTVRARDGKVLIDPIAGTLNSGRLHLEPEVVSDKQGKTWLHMGPSSGLLDAVVNDEASHRVLSFAAPVLDQATRVRGRVSIALSDAYVPLAQGPDVQARIDGDVLFDAVEFMPGPLAEQILGVFRQERRPLLVLRDPVSVRILGRKIYQEGLILPLGNVAAIGIEGWIDFDQNIDLVASFAAVPPQRNIPVLSDILANTQIQVPITGTLRKPKINGGAVGERFKEMGTNILDTLIGVGANGLNRVFRGGPPGRQPRRDFFPPFVPPGGDEIPPPPVPGAAPRDDDARQARGEQPRQGREPAPDKPDDAVDRPPSRPGQLTPEDRQMLREERRQRRLEKRAERRLRRGLNP
jgi:translocation and assembly module TamB